MSDIAAPIRSKVPPPNEIPGNAARRVLAPFKSPMITKGCFANPLAYSPDNAACVECQFRKQCLTALETTEVAFLDRMTAIANEETVRQKFAKARHRKAAIKSGKLALMRKGYSADEAESVAADQFDAADGVVEKDPMLKVEQAKRYFEKRRKPPKVRVGSRASERLRQVEDAGIDLSLVLDGINPVPKGKYDHLRLALDYALHAKCFKPKDLVEYYFDRGTGWTAGTRSANASLAIGILKAKELITKEGRGILCLRQK